MTNQEMTCQPQAIQNYLQGTLPQQEAFELEMHLDSCRSCQQKIVDAAAEDHWWHETQELLGQDDESSRPLSEALSFLNPSDDPRMMGRFGGYEIAGLIGQGGMGIVLKGFDDSLNRYAAIKVLAPQLATRGSARNRFAREAQAAAAVVHDNVIAIHGVSEAAGLPYLVMPYVRGESLQKRIDRHGSMSATEIVRVAHQIASGLSAAHKQGLVHRDIKPANILLPQGIQRVLITDFGLARAVDDSNLTGTGTIAGTPQFMSPEQARGETVDPRSDLFSLGTVMYAMCTGRNPFRAANPFSVLRRIIEDEPRDIRELNPEIPHWLKSIVSRLHEKLPEDRFQSATELAELLEKCLAHLQNPSVRLPEGLQKQMKPHRLSGRVLWVSAAILGLVGVIAAASVPSLWSKGKAHDPDLSVLKSSPSQMLPLAVGSIQDLEDGEEIEIAAGVSRRFKFDFPIPEIEIEKQDVIDVEMLSSKEIKLVGLQPGVSELVVRDADREPHHFKVQVLAADISSQLVGRWVLRHVLPLADEPDRSSKVRSPHEFKYDSETTQALLGGLKELLFDDGIVYGIREQKLAEGRGLKVQLLVAKTEADTDPLQMNWAEAHGGRNVDVLAEFEQDESHPRKLELTIGDEARCVFYRSSSDVLAVSEECNVIQSRHQRSLESGLSTSDYLGDLVDSFQKELGIIREIIAVEKQAAMRQGYMSEKELYEYVQSQKKAIAQEQDRRVQIKEDQEIKELARRLVSLKEEDLFMESLEVEREIFERLKKRDQDVLRLNELRVSMIDLRLDGEHKKADQVVEEMSQLESAIFERYDRLNQIIETQEKVRVQVGKLLKSVETLSEAGDMSEVDELRREIDSRLHVIKEGFQLKTRDNAATQSPVNKSELLDARIDFQQSLMNVKDAQSVVEHSQRLFEKGFVTKNQLDKDMSNLRIAELKLEKAREQLRAMAPDAEELKEQNQTPLAGGGEMFDARIAFQQASLDVKRSRDRLTSFKKLFEKNFVTEEQVEDEKGHLQIAELKLEKAREQLLRVAPEAKELQTDTKETSDASPPKPVYGIELFEGRTKAETMERLKMTLESMEPRLEQAKDRFGEDDERVTKMTIQIEHWKLLLAALKEELSKKGIDQSDQ